MPVFQCLCQSSKQPSNANASLPMPACRCCCKGQTPVTKEVDGKWAARSTRNPPGLLNDGFVNCHLLVATHKCGLCACAAVEHGALQVAVPLPDIKGRTELIEYYLHDKPFAADVDRDVLARQTQGRCLLSVMTEVAQ
eukprot:scaffold15528_cov20-Tisochrysis_lutea.AAC.3